MSGLSLVEPKAKGADPAGFASRFTYRVLEHIPVPELRIAAARILDIVNEKTAQRSFFETPVEVLEIAKAGMPAVNPTIASVLSPSQVRTFTGCAARWWYRYGLGLPDPPNAARALGSAVHDALGANFQQKRESQEDLDITGVAAVYKEAFDKHFEKVELRPEENAADLLRDGALLVQKYMLEAAPLIEPAAVEIAIEGEIGGVKVRGRLDLIDVEGTITDIKTAAKKPSAIDDMYRFQVTTYRQFAPGASGRVRLDTLVKTKVAQLVTQPWTINGKDLTGVQTIYPLAQVAMRSGVYMPNRMGMMCSRKNCPYWRQCEDEFGGEVSAT